LKLTEKNQLAMRQFSWERDSELVSLFHEDIVISSFPPRDMTVKAYRQRLRTSREHGLPAYMDTLKRAYNEGKDGMFILEIGDEAVERAR